MEKLYVAMMGLPARGKSTLAKRIKAGLEQQGIRTEIFNNGNTRRRLYGAASGAASFFNPYDRSAVERRLEIARLTMEEARQFMALQGDVAIIDATHGTREQRTQLLEYLNDYPVVFVECVNGHDDLLDSFISQKAHLDEFNGMPLEDVRAAFLQRIAFYESVYVPLDDSDNVCWMRVDPADCTVLSERSSSAIALYPAIRGIVRSRWVNNLYLVRHGVTIYNGQGRIGGDSPLSVEGELQAERLARYFRGVSLPYVFTSSKQRSKATAGPLIEERTGTAVYEMPEFDEINAGVCEEMTYHEVKRQMPLEYAARSANKYAYVYPGGESYAMLQQRVARGLMKALAIAKEDSLMIIGHQAINRTILSLFLAHRPSDIPYLHIPQNQFYHISVTNSKKLFELIRYA